MRSVLVVAAHPDDESLGCGGAIARLAAQGSIVRVAFMSDGISSRPSSTGSQERELASRQAAARAACKELGAAAPTFGTFPDNRMDSVDLIEITRTVEALIQAFDPDTVFTHHAGDLNIDHRGFPVRTILCFEVPSSTEWQAPGSGPSFAPNWYMDISSTLSAKLAALGHYAREMRAFPHPRSLQAVEHLARWRGATVGVEAAEAFVVGRIIT